VADRRLGSLAQYLQVMNAFTAIARLNVPGKYTAAASELLVIALRRPLQPGGSWCLSRV